MRTLRRLSFILLAVLTHGLAHAADSAPPTFKVWVFSDAHVGTDRQNGRDSLAIALTQSESPAGFAWDIALDLGDVSGAQGTPKDAEGQEIVRQFSVLKQHHREQIYDLSGNHDRSGLDEPQAWWWRKWIDPTGEHTEFSGVDAKKRPYPIEGTWERYSFRVGNLLFLMMSDINEPSQKVGRGTLGGNPGGAISGETFRWWQRMVDSRAFENVLTATPGVTALWLGAHTHTTPDDNYGGKSHIEKKWGTAFINVAELTQYHGTPENQVPRSWLLTFTEGSDEVKAQCYLHGDSYAPQGWYDKVSRTIKLPKRFSMPARAQ